MNIAYWHVRHARRHGDEIGLIVADKAWTNSELHQRAGRLAATFVALGLQPGDRVAIALPNCVELFDACAATWLAGGVVVLVGDGPETERNRLIADCTPALIVEARHSRNEGEGRESSFLAVVSVNGSSARDPVRFDDALRDGRMLDRPVPRRKDAPAQLSYTSGTTGKPKGVIYTHGGIDRFLRAYAARRGGAAANAVLLVALPPTAFGAALLSVRVTGTVRLVVLQRFAAQEVIAAIERYRVTDLSVVPAMAEQLVAAPPNHGHDTSSLKFVSIGGAHVSAALVANLRRCLAGGAAPAAGPTADVAVEPTLTVRVQYGMTEMGGACASTTAGGDGIVGRIAPGAEVRILGADDLDVPPGEIGEIVARTPYSAIGYWNDPASTEKVFRDGFVRSGDVGRFNEARELCVLGRKKELIIQGGQNIYPEEIGSVVRTLDGVVDCGVVGRPDDLLGEAAVAFVVLERGSGITTQSVRRHCRRHLNARKIPARVLFVESLPRTPVGKLQIDALKELAAEDSVCSADENLIAQLGTAVPRQRAELIARIVDEALAEALSETEGDARCARVDPETTFRELGLDSVAIVQLAYELSRRLGWRVSPTVLFTYPTISKLIAHVGDRWRSPDAVEALPKLAERPPLGDTVAVALTGIGCRLPGHVKGPREFWELLQAGRDAVGPPPADRRACGAWGRKSAGFVASMEMFDAQFFKLTAEAPELDPRHRLLLELAWEALEDSGSDPLALPSDRVGVFLGMYGERYQSVNPLGVAPGMAAARLCHFLDLRGPTVTVDTTCSSSLVAVHYAVESLRRRECDLAIVGGANVLPTRPYVTSGGFLAADGRSKAFDAAADGFGQGEGAVLIVLKRVEDAVADSDRIYATIRGTATNHDGRSSSLTAPNAHAQETVIRDALRRAGVKPDEVQYVEAHGTGTLLGDPIEVEGLARAFSPRASAKLAIGSVKTNIGHLEAAAGVAGLAKLALAIFHRQLPASLHFTNPNPHIPWNDVPVRVQNGFGSWPREDVPLIGGVSSFGMSGTNAHAILAEAPSDARHSDRDRAEPSQGSVARLLPLSAKSPEALRAITATVASTLEASSDVARDVDIAYTASCRRAHLEHRAAVVGSSRAEWLAGLRRLLARGDFGKRSRAERERKVAFVFTGQGPQWWGMAASLLREEPVFEKAVEECCACVNRQLSWRLMDQLSCTEQRSGVAATEVAQPALFALQVGLCTLWRSWGIEPDVVAGHSLGEVAAAWAAGALSLDEAARLVCARGRIMEEASGNGRMAHVAMSASSVAELLADSELQVEVAASNSPLACTLSGDAGALQRATQLLEERGAVTKLLSVNCAFHSRQMVSLARRLAAEVEPLATRDPVTPIVSSVTGAFAPRLDASYWARQMRSPVDFLQATRTLLDAGAGIFIEIGPHPVLAPFLEETLRHHERDATVVASQRREMPGRRTMLEALGGVYCAGARVKWASQYSRNARVASLPSYVWQHRRYWSDSLAPLRQPRIAPLVHEWLPSMSAPDTHYFESRIDVDDEAFSHFAAERAFGEVRFPPSVFLETAWEAATHAFGSRLSRLEQVRVENTLVLAPGEPCRLQLVFEARVGGECRFQIHARDERAKEGLRLVTGVAVLDGVSSTPPRLAVAEVQGRCKRSSDARGDAVWCGDAEMLAKLPAVPPRPSGQYAVHPALLEAAFRVALETSRSDGGDGDIAFDECEFAVFAPGRAVSWVHARSHRAAAGRLVRDMNLCDADGRLVARARVPIVAAARVGWPGPAQALYDVDWQETLAAPASRPTGTWIVFNDRGGVAAAVARELTRHGARVLSVDAGREYRRRKDGSVELRLEDPEHMRRLLQDVEPPKGIVHMCSIDFAGDGSTTLRDVKEAGKHGVLSALHIVQGVLAARWEHTQRIAFVTRGAQPIGGVAPGFAQAPLWGFAASISREHEDCGVKLIDLDPHDDGIELLCSELGADDGEDRIAFRDGRRLVPRLRKHRCAAPMRLPVRPDRGYLITGAFGALGMVVARRLANLGVRHLALLGRRAPSDAVQRELRELAAGGASVHIGCVNVEDHDALATSLRDIESRMPPLKGVVHCAGTLRDAAVRNLDESSLWAVFEPKSIGAWNLHELTRELEFFVLFSSAAGVLGNPGQANYAAANTFLDSLAHFRRSKGFPAQSICWGGWRIGMAASLQRSADAIDAAYGADIFEHLLRDEAAQVLAFDGGVRALCAHDESLFDRPLFAEFAAGSRRTSSWPASPAPHRLLEHGSGGTSRESLSGHLLAWIAELADVPEERIEPDATFGDLGIDSLGAIRLRERLKRELDATVPLAELERNTTLLRLLDLVAARCAPDTGVDVELPARDPLVWLRRHGEDPLVVFVHPAGGGVQCYQAVADALPHRAVAIESPALRNAVTPIESIEGMAERYLELLAGIGISAPTSLVGWSLGGLIAFEMASRLQARGQLPSLVLIDAHPSNADRPATDHGRVVTRAAGLDHAIAGAPGQDRSSASADVAVLHRFLDDVTSAPLRAERTTEMTALAAELASLGTEPSAERLVAAASRCGLIRDVPVSDAVRMFGVFRANLRAVGQYRPPVYRGPVTSVAAVGTGGWGDATQAWKKLAPNLRAERVDADHYSIMSRPALDQVVAILVRTFCKPGVEGHLPASRSITAEVHAGTLVRPRAT